MAEKDKETANAPSKAPAAPAAASTEADATSAPPAAAPAPAQRQIQPKQVIRRGAMVPVAKTNINTGSAMIAPGDKILDAAIIAQLVEGVHYEMRFMPEGD